MSPIKKTGYIGSNRYIKYKSGLTSYNNVYFPYSFSIYRGFKKIAIFRFKKSKQ